MSVCYSADFFLTQKPGFINELLMSVCPILPLGFRHPVEDIFLVTFVRSKLFWTDGSDFLTHLFEKRKRTHTDVWVVYFLISLGSESFIHWKARQIMIFFVVLPLNLSLTKGRVDNFLFVFLYQASLFVNLQFLPLRKKVVTFKEMSASVCKIPFCWLTVRLVAYFMLPHPSHSKLCPTNSLLSQVPVNPTL